MPYRHRCPILHTIFRGGSCDAGIGTGVCAVRDLILRGDFAAGSRLGEVELAERLGVSRTPVREALTRLAGEGLVQIIPNRGARVSNWTLAELEGVFDLRAALEPRLTARAVPRATAAEVAALDALATEVVAV
ncbi:MAG: hypothetical protein V7646_5690, partial [Pseudonocardia sp.]